MSNFTRLSMKTVYDSLHAFCNEHDINMGVDESDNRPNVIKYVFFYVRTGRGCMIVFDFEQVEDLDKAIDICLDRLEIELKLNEFKF